MVGATVQPVQVNRQLPAQNDWSQSPSCSARTHWARSNRSTKRRSRYIASHWVGATDGATVGDRVKAGERDGVVVGDVVGGGIDGEKLGDADGEMLGAAVGGLADGDPDGAAVGTAVGCRVGRTVGGVDGASVGDVVGATVQPVQVNRQLLYHVV